MAGRSSVFVLMSLFVAAMLHCSSAQTTHVVGDSLGWLVPPGGDVAYRTWAATRTFAVGDVLVFNFTTNQHNVAEVSKESYDACNSTSPISLSTNGPANITLRSPGEHHFICTFPSHCASGQKLAINVSAVAPAPQPTSPAPSAAPESVPSPAVTPAPSPSRVGMTYTVGDSIGWRVPPGGQVAYQTWASGKNFMVGDILVFNFTNGQHSVLEVTRAEFDSCTTSTTTNPPTTTGPARITLSSAGEHYYMCTVPQHCSFGQKLAINVTGTPASGAAPTPSSATPSPNSGGPTPSTRIPVFPPPPPSSSAHSFAVAALPFTFLAVVMAVLYN